MLTDRSMIVIVALVLAGVAVLVAVVFVGMGRGGELAEVHPDHPPLPLPLDRPIGGIDAALLHLPRGLWGYQTDVADEAMRRLAYALTERDTRVAVLEQQLAEISRRLQTADQKGEWAEAPRDDMSGTPWSPPEPYDPGTGYAGRHAGHVDEIAQEDE